MAFDGYDHPAYHTAAYRRARHECLKRARWRCEIRIEGVCIGTASEADHAAGIASDPLHKTLRAACKPCHRYMTQKQSNAGRKGPADPKPQPRTVW